MTKALMIPWDEDKPIVEADLEENRELEQMETLIFGPTNPGAATSRILGSSVLKHGIQAFHDDEGMWNQPFNVNLRVMKLWAHLTGRKVSDFRQPLWGNWVVYGFNEEGESVDVPGEVTDFFGEEVKVNG